MYYTKVKLFLYKIKQYIVKKILQRGQHIEFTRCSSYEEAIMKSGSGYESSNIKEEF